VHVWVNGQLLDDPTAPTLRVDDHGLVVGDGVFESVEVTDGRAFALTRHLDRLLVSAAGLGLTGVDLDDVRAGVDATLAAEHLERGKLRITVTGGPGPLGSARGDGPLTVVVAAEPIGPSDASAAIVTVPWLRNERGALSGLKTTSYADNVIALAEARRHGASEAIFANLAGNLCEGTGSNVFYVVDGELRTPTLASGCLAGVTRALILEWYGGREVDEPIGVAEDADEVFIVSTTRAVQPVHRWGSREWTTPGPITTEAQAAWRAREGDDVDP